MHEFELSDERADDPEYDDWQAGWDAAAAEHESLDREAPQPAPPVIRCPECVRSVDACQCDTNPFSGPWDAPEVETGRYAYHLPAGRRDLEEWR